MRAEFLRDYLAARSMVLRLTTYRQRREILADRGHIGWNREGHREQIFDGRFEGRAWDIHEGGRPFGEEIAVFHMSRTDVDFEADVPTMGNPNDENVASTRWNVGSTGPKLCHVEGEFWRDEWIEPAARSPRVRGDQVPSAVSFVIDAAGGRASADELKRDDIGRWLWFSPQIVGTILGRRGSRLSWYTRDTGSLGLLPTGGVHFGLNENDLLTVYARDAARLPEWQRRVWAGFNVSPDGGVSRELLASQVEAKPAITQAPEEFVGPGLEAANAGFRSRWGKPLLRENEITSDLLARVHRFRSLDQAGLFALAKDVSRLTVDSFDLHALHEFVPLGRDEKRGSLKSLERLLAKLIGDVQARRLMGPLVGIYELRLGDAHIPSTTIAEAGALVGIDPGASWIGQGTQLLHQAVSTLYTIADIFRVGPT